MATPTAGIAAAAPNSLTTPPPDAAAAATPPLTGENFNLRSVLLKAHAPGVLAVKYARAKRLLSLPSDAPLLQAVRIFATGIHRLSVVDSSTGELLGVLSQSVAVRYLWSRASSVSALMDRPVRSLGLGVEPVVSVRDSQTVISALATMHRDRLSSVAILDRQGGILGTLSLTDIKYIFAKREHSLLWTSCIAFVRYVREQDVPVPLPSTTSNSSGSGTPPPPPPAEDMFPYVSIHAGTPLRIALEKFVATRVHRLWLLQGTRTPTGVLSLTDLLRATVPGGGLSPADLAAATASKSCADTAGFAED